MNQNNMNNNNMNTNVGITNPSSGAVYTSGTNFQQNPGVSAGAVYTSGVNNSGIQSNYNQRNTNNLAGVTDSSSGAVYTSSTYSQQDPGVAAGAVYTSGVNTSGVQSNFNQQRNVNSNLNNNWNNNLNNNITDSKTGAVYTSNLYSQQDPGVTAGAVYTSGVNTLGAQNNYNQQRNVNSNLNNNWNNNLNNNLNNNINSNINNNITDPRSGAVYTSNINFQQDPGAAAGAVYTSGVSTSGMQTNYNQQRNFNNVTDINSGAVYTSDLQQGPSNASVVNNYGMKSNVSTGSMGMTGISNVGTSNVQQIKQQLQNIQTHLRQPNSSGSVNEAYTDAANRLQDVFEILNNSSL